MATKRSSKAAKAGKDRSKRSKRIPSVKRLDHVRTLSRAAGSDCGGCAEICTTHLVC